ncbi:MAG: DUF4339 domain-containing protein [Fibromonadaceae bacterium]|nr:DUF4339 domain-containing protein [Fibromonadaceae bacterium]
MDTWYMRVDGQQHGPFNIDELLQKGLNDDSLVRKAETADWLVAKEIPEMLDAFSIAKMKNEIEIDTFKFMADENSEFQLQVKQLEKSYEELLDEESGIKAILKATTEKANKLRSQIDQLEKNNEESSNFRLDLTTKLKALENENVELRSKLKQIFTKLIRGLEG